MIYNNKTLNTFGKVFDEGLHLARENKEEAQEFFKEYIHYISKENGCSLEEAERIAKSNFGYFAGYYDQEVCDIIYSTFECAHPIFGNKPFSISAEDAYKKGLEIGRQMQ